MMTPILYRHVNTIIDFVQIVCTIGFIIIRYLKLLPWLRCMHLLVFEACSTRRFGRTLGTMMVAFYYFCDIQYSKSLANTAC